MPTPLLKIFYASCCAESITPTTVRQIVGQSQMMNRRAGITGVLAYTGRHFAQALEGQAADVVPLMQAIRMDRRHGDVRVLVREDDSPLRRFDGWSMHLLDSPDLDDSLGQLLTAAPADLPRLAAQTLERIADMARHACADDLMATRRDGPRGG